MARPTWADEAIAMYLDPSKMPVGKICVELDIHTPQLYKLLREEGIPLRGSQKGMTGRARRPSLRIGHESPAVDIAEKLVVKRIVDIYREQGIPAKQIADIVGMPYAYVLNVLHQNGVDLLPGRSTVTFRMLRNDIQNALLKEGLTVNEVLERFGISSSTLYRALRGVAGITRAKAQQFSRPEFYEQIINDVMLRLKEDLQSDAGIQLTAQAMWDPTFQGESNDEPIEKP